MSTNLQSKTSQCSSVLLGTDGTGMVIYPDQYSHWVRVNAPGAGLESKEEKKVPVSTVRSTTPASPGESELNARLTVTSGLSATTPSDLHTGSTFPLVPCETQFLKPPPSKGFELLSGSPYILTSMKSALSSTHKAVLGTSISISASGTGFVNAAISVNTVTALGEFPSYASLYGEFFVTSVEVMYQPQSQYGSWPASSQGATGQPLAVLSMHHGVPPQSTIVAAAPNASLAYAHTSQPWKYKWRNIESSRSKTVISPVTTSAVPTQGWCLTDSTSAAAYTGLIQFLSPTTLGVGANQVLGNFLVKYEVLFRNRQ